MTTFEGLTLYPRLSRLPGMETADVLSDDRPVRSFERNIVKDVLGRCVLKFSFVLITHFSCSLPVSSHSLSHSLRVQKRTNPVIWNQSSRKQTLTFLPLLLVCSMR